MSPAEQAARLRNWLKMAKISQRRAARLLEMRDRDMRAYCSGNTPVPRVIMLATLSLVHEDSVDLVT